MSPSTCRLSPATCREVLAHEVRMNIQLLHVTDHDVIAMQMADGDEDDLACLSAAVVIAGVVRRRRQRRRCRSCWVRPWMCSRPRLGGYAALLQDIISTDEKAYLNFCRLCPGDYNQLLTMVAPVITHKDTHCLWILMNVRQAGDSVHTVDTCRCRLLHVAKSWTCSTSGDT